MRRKQITFTAYELLLEHLENYTEENKHPSIPEAVRDILEQWFMIHPDDRQAYRDFVKTARSKGNTSVTRKKGRKAVKLQIRKAMEKGQTYTLTEMAKLGGVGRKIAKDILDSYPADFKLVSVDGKAFRIRKTSKKEKEKILAGEAKK